MNKLKNTVFASIFAVASLCTIGCNIQDVPPGYKGIEFDKSGWGNSKGFIGGVKEAGSHDLAWNNELRLVECSEEQIKETFKSPSKDGVEFGSDLYVRFQANCDDPEAVVWILKNMQPGAKDEAATANASEKVSDDADSKLSKRTIAAEQLQWKYLRPLLGEAVRDAFAAYNSDEIVTKRDAIALAITSKFKEKLKSTFEGSERPAIIMLHETTLSAVTFPEKMVALNTELANRKTEIRIEEENKKRVLMQIETAKSQKDLEKVTSEKSVQNIAMMGKVLREYPEFIEWQRVIQLPSVYQMLGMGGGTIIFGNAPDTLLNVQPKKKD